MALGDRVAILPHRTLAVVAVQLNGQRDFLLLVDTGAERLVISRRVAARLGLDLARPLRQEPLIGVGQTATVPVVQLQSVLQVGSAP